MKDDISFSIKLELKDYRNFNFSYLYGGAKGKMYIIVAILILFGCAYYLKYLINYGKELTLLNVLLPFLPVVYFVLMPILIFFQSKNIFKSDKLLSNEQNYSFNNDGFTISNDSLNAKISYDKIFLARENKNYLFIFTAKNKAFIIPKKDITKQVVKIKRLLFDNLEKKKLKLKKIGAIF